MPKQTGKRKTCETSARRTHKLISLLNTKVDLLQDSINMVNDNVNSVIDTLENKAGSAYLTPLLTQEKSSVDSMSANTSDDIVASPPRDDSIGQETMSEDSNNEIPNNDDVSGISTMSNVTSPSETDNIIASPARDATLSDDQFSDMTNPSDSGTTDGSETTGESETLGSQTTDGSGITSSVYQIPMESESETKGGRRRQKTNKRNQRKQRNSKRRNRRM